jgi:UDP-N-acetylmuramyl pentapeptide phosphotransferase/UDP-N-acetylglucosamine-1-phosphate transferase
MIYFLILLLPILVYLLNTYLINRSILLNYSGDKHQKFTLERQIPLSGGIFLALGAIIIFHNFFKLNTFIFLIFLLGIFSDLKILNSAKFRFSLQILLLFLFIFIGDIYLQNTKVIFIDQLLNNKIFNYLFVLFCMLILINGTNFIDGLNTNVLGYYIILSIFLSQTSQDYFTINYPYWNLWIFILIILYLFNFFNKLFIGDSGSYILGFFYGYIIIETYVSNQNLSPFYIVLLVWYPCFETLFSIIRKFRFRKSPILPDTKHFHQLLYQIIKKKIKLSNVKSNVLGSHIINFYNLIIIFLASIYPNNTQYQIILLFLNIFVYCYVYFKFFKFIYLKKVKFD